MGYYPRTDVSIDDQGLLIEMAVPGLNMSDITLELVNNSLVVSARMSERNQHARYIEKELYTGYFTRQYSINPTQFDTSKIVSKVVNGFLTVKVPYKSNINTNRIKTLDIQEDK